jgi:LPXTG-site transpeptidase (sortase) family protein
MTQVVQPASISKAKLVALYRQAMNEGVALDKVNDKINSYLSRSTVAEKIDSQRVKELPKTWNAKLPVSIRVFSWLLPSVFVAIGLLLLSSAVLPIGFHLIKTAPELRAAELLSPIPKEDMLDVMPMVIAPAATVSSNARMAAAPTILDIELDYTNLSNWFVTPVPEMSNTPEPNQDGGEYIVEIPKLNIHGAKVLIGGSNLNKSLIQFPGTANPGEVGSPVIFGHSVLRQFYNPNVKNPNRYNSIFSTIMTLKKGDEITIIDDGITYTYQVMEKTEVKPEDTYILAQRRDSKLLKLVTCVPEGTYLRRGVVTAQLIDNKGN